MINEAIQEIESSIHNCKHLIETGKALERLLGNRDFITVFKKGYFEEEAIRLVHLKADPAMQTAERQHSIDEQILAIGNVSTYLREVSRQAGLAEKQLEQDEAMREELLHEGVE